MGTNTGEKFTISVADTGKQFLCGADEPVFVQLIHNRAGEKNHGCCGGGCGVCKMKVVSGEYDQFKAMSAAHVSEADIKNKIVLLCCVKPRSDMVVARVI